MDTPLDCILIGYEDSSLIDHIELNLYHQINREAKLVYHTLKAREAKYVK